MTDKIKALKELKAAIENGSVDTLFHPLFEKAFYSSGNDMASKVYLAGSAWDGNHNAVFALINECLGNRWPRIKLEYRPLYHDGYTSNMWDVRLQSSDITKVYGLHEFLPTAILLAVIEALIYEGEK